MAGIDAVDEAGVLHAAFTLGEDFQLALWTIDQLFVVVMDPLHQRDLRILLAVGHQERHADAIQYAVQVHLFEIAPLI